jgi:hypothetical protein
MGGSGDKAGYEIIILEVRGMGVSYTILPIFMYICSSS